MCTENKALLTVSFGTSVNETREKTIDAIEAALKADNPDRKMYRAWTSKMIIRKIQNRDGVKIDTVEEAMNRMKADGITDLIVQPTHIINGIENDLMKQDVLSHAQGFESVRFGAPLLTSTKDNEEAILALMEEWKDLPKEDVLVLMGHGTTHYANSAYAALDYTFKDLGYNNVFLGTVEAYPSMVSLLKQVKKYHPQTVHLAPFMVVAGDHATNDMAGDDPDSWRCQFEKEGFTVNCHMKGLGEYQGIRSLFLKHARESLQADT